MRFPKLLRRRDNGKTLGIFKSIEVVDNDLVVTFILTEEGEKVFKEVYDEHDAPPT